MLTWYRATAGQCPVPVVVILGWMQAQQKHVAVYGTLFSAELHADAVSVRPEPLNLWLPFRARALARRVLDELRVELERSGPRPIAFACFSGSAKACYVAVLHLLANDASYSAVRCNLVGEMYDSSPIDFRSRAGVLFLAPTGASVARRASVAALATALDALFGPTFERQRREFWRSITQSLPPACPVLLLHSEDDALSPAAFIRAFETELRRNGRTNVRRVCWQQSAHVAHLRRHPEEYTAAVRQWLDDCIRCWQSASRNGPVASKL
jgi:pimeloyl-ACP methyl ester carboxylesterase